MNYDGKFTEYAIVDKRMAITVSVTYLAIRLPTASRWSEVIFTAYDQCGRVCHPSCLDSTTGRYVPCSGAVRITANDVSLIPKDYGETIMENWDFASEKNCPQFSSDKIHVSFYCDFTNRWPWEEARKVPEAPRGRVPDNLKRPTAPGDLKALEVNRKIGKYMYMVFLFVNTIALRATILT